MTKINPLKAAYVTLLGYRARRPAPTGSGTFDHSALGPVLDALAEGGVPAIPKVASSLGEYLGSIEQIDPDDLTREHALAFWINAYNASALRAAGEAFDGEMPTVFRIKKAFQRPEITVAGEALSLAKIENGKVRRFGDPRIHAALVCGAVSCPTLRFEPYRGDSIEEQLEDQMRFFLASGGLDLDRESNVARPSRILLWYGADFARPQKMPALVPPRPRTLLRILAAWLPEEAAAWIEESKPRVEFQRYDFGLACAVR